MALRAGLYDEVFFPFPQGLMSTARAARALTTKYAQHLENMIPSANREGAGVTRFGSHAKGDAIGGGLTIIELLFYRTSSGTEEKLAVMSDGSLRKYVGPTWTTVTGGGAGALATDSFIRTEFMNGTLVIADGVHNLQGYDGTSLAVLKDWVEDTSASAWTKVDSDTFTIVTARGDTNYPNGRRVRLTTDAGLITATIATTSYNSGTSTLTVNLTTTAISGAATITAVDFEVSAPVLSDVFKFNDYLFGLSAGKPHPSTFRGSEGLKVYHTFVPNNPAAWVHGTTLGYSFTNMADKHNAADEFLKLASIDGLLVCLGRQGIQLWAGDDPNTAGSFSWQKTIPVGILSGALVQHFPGDVLFFTKYGGRSLRRVFQTESLEIADDLGGEVDPTVTKAVKDLLASATTYLQAYSFIYQRDGFYGFRISGKPLVFFLSSKAGGWEFFSGIFESATVCRASGDGALYLAKGDQLYTYANGADDEEDEVVYSDAGASIRQIWFLPWQTFRARWTNRYWQLLLESSDESVEVSLTRFTDSDSNEGVEVPFVVDASSAFWDEAEWDVDGWAYSDKEPLARDKFVCSSMAAVLTLNGTKKIEILGIKAIGN